MTQLKSVINVLFTVLILATMTACTTNNEIKTLSCGSELSENELAQKRQQVIKKVQDTFLSKDFEVLLTFYSPEIQKKIKLEKHLFGL